MAVEHLAMEEVVAEPTFTSAFCAKAYDFLQSELEKKNADGHRIHIDACSLLEEWTVGMVPTLEGEETGAHVDACSGRVWCEVEANGGDHSSSVAWAANG